MAKDHAGCFLQVFQSAGSSPSEMVLSVPNPSPFITCLKRIELSVWTKDSRNITSESCGKNLRGSQDFAFWGTVFVLSWISQKNGWSQKLSHVGLVHCPVIPNNLKDQAS